MTESAHQFCEEALLGLSIREDDGEFSLVLDFAKIDTYKATYGANTFVKNAILYIEEACRQCDLGGDEDLWVAAIKNHLGESKEM
jgi:hypothetical protein